MRPPHIVFLCNEYPPSPGGGIGTFYQTLGRALVKQGWDVTVAGYYRNYKSINVTNDCGVSVCRLPASPDFRGRFRFNMLLDRLRLGWQIRILYAQKPYDLLEAADYQGLSWAMPKKAPIIVRIHGADLIFLPLLGMKPNSWKAYFEKKALLDANFIIGSSIYISNQAQEALGNKRKITKTIYNMVDVEVFSPRNSVLRNVTTVASVATLTRKKGIYQLLDAWQDAHLSFPGSTLLYYGRDTRDNDGRSNLEKMKALVNEKQLADSVRFMGSVPYTELVNVFLETGILVFPSFLEAHPRAWLEAMSAGAPIIGSRLGPGVEVIDDGKTGLLVDPGDTKDLAEKIKYLLSNPAFAKTLGERARQSMLERFSSAVILKQNIDFYHLCIDTSFRH